MSIVQPRNATFQREQTAAQGLAGEELRGLAAYVLVVEDDALIALELEQMLTDLGAERVTIALDLSMALSSLEAGLPDLAILDLDLGAHDSLPLARLLAEAGKPFLFLTGYQAEHMNKLRDAGCRALVMEKPFSVEELAGLVTGMLKPM